MNNPLILGFALLAAVMLFAVVATSPGINLYSTEIPQVYAVDSGSDKECLSASSALFFDTQSALTASA
jgi:hypothetical protein